jgi:hypothetical protein
MGCTGGVMSSWVVGPGGPSVLTKTEVSSVYMFITHKPLVKFRISKLPQLIGIFFCNQTFSASSGRAFSQVKSTKKRYGAL